MITVKALRSYLDKIDRFGDIPVVMVIGGDGLVCMSAVAKSAEHKGDVLVLADEIAAMKMQKEGKIELPLDPKKNG